MMANKQKRWGAIILVNFLSEDFFKAKDKIEDLNEEFNTYHGDSNILCLFEEAK